jgi:HAD superfamily hydrolase (TIGR01509 family)
VNDRLSLEAVVFDAGGTLVRLDFEWIAIMLAELEVPVTVEALRQGEIHGRRLYDAVALEPRALEPGEAQPPIGTVAPIEAYWGGMLQAAGCPRDRLDTALERMAARQRSDAFLWAKPMEGAREAMDALLAMGLRLACVSNSDGRAEEHLVRFGLREGLEFVVDSHLVGIEKPDPRIFDIALEKLDVWPIRALYVGDIRSVDEHGSLSAGMQFVLLDPYGTYARRDTASITGIDRLPAFVSENFVTPNREPRRRS